VETGARWLAVNLFPSERPRRRHGSLHALETGVQRTREDFERTGEDFERIWGDLERT
jgi:hypothetical protein